ncbi:hypothetical protein GQ43DRAFT_430052 [Delitschia confertaspora ATCC 74209]|uniref:Uncharacterized protein n=1 Tax=Delitschia confertaspora ATCC 74209 TaxID=1513339 RepID=A0A9P4JPE7_9PLEO|nr:hypothetical protein GQ43DRAFT_430052 [Delitschia confertaspora ATCC 74209]
MLQGERAFRHHASDDAFLPKMDDDEGHDRLSPYQHDMLAFTPSTPGADSFDDLGPELDEPSFAPLGPPGTSPSRKSTSAFPDYGFDNSDTSISIYPEDPISAPQPADTHLEHAGPSNFDSSLQSGNPQHSEFSPHNPTNISAQLLRPVFHRTYKGKSHRNHPYFLHRRSQSQPPVEGTQGAPRISQKPFPRWKSRKMGHLKTSSNPPTSTPASMQGFLPVPGTPMQLLRPGTLTRLSRSATSSLLPWLDSGIDTDGRMISSVSTGETCVGMRRLAYMRLEEQERESRGVLEIGAMMVVTKASMDQAGSRPPPIDTLLDMGKIGQDSLTPDAEHPGPNQADRITAMLEKMEQDLKAGLKHCAKGLERCERIRGSLNKEGTLSLTDTSEQNAGQDDSDGLEASAIKTLSNYAGFNQVAIDTDLTSAHVDCNKSCEEWVVRTNT